MYFQRFFTVILCAAIVYIANVDANDTKPNWEQITPLGFRSVEPFILGFKNIIRVILNQKPSIPLLDQQVGKDLKYKLFNGHMDKFSIVGYTIRDIKSSGRLTLPGSFYWPELEVNYDYKINDDDEPKKIRCKIEPINVRINIDIDTKNHTSLFSGIDFNCGAMKISIEGHDDPEQENEPDIFRDFEDIITNELTVQFSDLWSLVVDRLNENSKLKYTHDSVIPVDH